MASSISPSAASNVANTPPPQQQAAPAPQAPKPAAPEPAGDRQAVAAKSEQSAASDRVGNELSAQLSQTRASTAEANGERAAAVSQAQDAANLKQAANAESKASAYKSVASEQAGPPSTVKVSA